MSTMQNFSTAPRICNTREPSWAEDFIDLSEFCQPSIIPTKMEDLVDERITSPISSTVRDHGFDYALEINDGLDNTIEDNLWCMPSPIAMQEELCDPISDWLKVTKESNSANTNHSSNNTNNNDNSSSRTQPCYNLNDTLLSSTLTSVPKIAEYIDGGSSGNINNSHPNPSIRKHHQPPSISFLDDKVSSPPLQPDTTFFHSESATSMFSNNRGGGGSDSRNPTLTENLFNAKSTTGMSATTIAPPTTRSSTNSIFSEKIPDTTFSFQTTPFLEQRKPETSAMSRVTIDTNVSSPCSVQSPSITQSNLNQEENVHQSAVAAVAAAAAAAATATSGNIVLRRNVRLKLKMEESAGPSCCIDTPQLLQPLVTKNSEFDLVSYVFDDNKPSTSFDVSSLQDAGTRTSVALNIKTEPKEEPCTDHEEFQQHHQQKKQQPPQTQHLHHHHKGGNGTKRKYEKDEDDDDFYQSGGSNSSGSKRTRRYSSRSSTSNIEDITQLESEKYRELRNRNNEASRRSRANRKSREVEMKNHANKLEAENRRLKVKAEEMEQLVKRLRHCLMQLVLKRR